MAEAADNEKMECDEKEKKKKTVLEEKSHDELVKIVKKQLALLQKAKSKADDYAKKCTELEEEKEIVLKKYDLAKEELRTNARKFEDQVLQLTLQHDNAQAEKEEILHQFQKTLETTEKEKASHFSAINDKDEQVQCLSRQLKTIKDTCQCLQEEIIKLEQSNKGMKEEIINLSDEKEEALTLLATNVEKMNLRNSEFENLHSQLSNSRDEHAISIETIRLHNEKIDSLKIEMQNICSEKLVLASDLESTKTEMSRRQSAQIDTSELSILLMDNQKFQKEITQLKNELSVAHSSSSEHQAPIDDQDVINDSKLDTFDAHRENNKQDNEMQHLEKSSNSPPFDYEELTNEILSLKSQLEQLEAEKCTLDKNMDCLMKDKLKLEEENKGLLMSLHETNDFKAGFEHALLYGATTESLSNNEQHSTYKEKSQYVQSDESTGEIKKVSQQHYNVSWEPGEDVTGGFESALLAGGDLSLFGKGESEVDAKVIKNNDDNSAVDLLQNVKAEKVLLEKEVVCLKRDIEEYSLILKETKDDNERLKLQLNDAITQKSSISVKETAVNTENEVVDKSVSEEQIESLKNKYESFKTEFDNEHLRFNNRILEFEAENNALESKYAEAVDKLIKLENINNDLTESCGIVEKQCKELSDKCEEKQSELTYANSEITSLVCSIDKNLVCESELQLAFNLNTLKNQLCELMSNHDEYYNKISQLELDLNCLRTQNQATIEEANQLKELNQFLELEMKLSKNKVDDGKSSSKVHIEKYDASYHPESFFPVSSELYSIEETNEFDEKAITVESTFENESVSEKTEPMILESVETPNKCLQLPTMIDSSTQVDFTYTEFRMDAEDSRDSKVSETYKHQKSIEELAKLKEEHLCLKLTLDDKSKLVEELHCNLDNHLEKVETLNSELEHKEIELNCAVLEEKKLKKEMEELSVRNDSQNVILQSLMAFLNVSENFAMWSNAIEQLNKVLLNFDSYDSVAEHFMKMDELCSINFTPVNIEVFNYSENIIEESKTRVCDFFHSLKQFLRFTICDSVMKELDRYRTETVPSLRNENDAYKLKISELSQRFEAQNNGAEESSQEKKDSLEATNKNLKEQLDKLKRIAARFKKELTDSRKQCEELKSAREKKHSRLDETQKEMDMWNSEQMLCMQNYQSLQKDYDDLQDQIESQKENTKKLETDFAKTLQELNSFKEKTSDLEKQLSRSKEYSQASASDKNEIEKRCNELESKIIIMESQKQKQLLNLKNSGDRLAEMQANTSGIMEEIDTLKQQLKQAQKEGKKKNLLDLEIADYEKSITELNNQIQGKENETADLRQKLNDELETIQSLQETINSTEKLKETEEKRANGLKEALDKSRRELTNAKKHEEELRNKVSTQEMQLEVLTQQEENAKLQLGEASSEIQHLKEMLKSSTENHHRIAKSLETKITNQKKDILCAHKEVEDVKQDFENYKIRVHSVLKQQKQSTPISLSDSEDIKEQLEAIIEKLKTQLKTLNGKLTAVSMEYEALQEDHDGLMNRYNKSISDREQKESEWHAKLEQLNVEKNKLRVTQEELSSQHLLQSEMLVSTYKKQIKIMNGEHKKTVSDLQKQLESADIEISRLQRDQQKTQCISSSPAMMQESSGSLDFLLQERQEGEGSENNEEMDIPLRNLSLTTIPTSGFMSFEKLLQSPIEDDNISTISSCNACDKFVMDLNVSNKKIDHLSEVLNDSESTNMRMSEQIRVLKEEVRRLERNKEREKHAENLEYLKNVFIKFSTLSACSEKAMLIPVLTTMLKLSPDEQSKLKNVAGDVDSNESSNAGWGSYIHRWSGLA